VQTLLNASDWVANRLFFHLKRPIRWRMPVDTPEKWSPESTAVTLRRMALSTHGGLKILLAHRLALSHFDPIY
jgi:hypothetical protein